MGVVLLRTNRAFIQRCGKKAEICVRVSAGPTLAKTVSAHNKVLAKTEQALCGQKTCHRNMFPMVANLCVKKHPASVTIEVMGGAQGE